MTTLSPIRRSSRTDDNASSVDVIGIINRVGNAETDTAVAATIFKRNEIIQWSMPVEERPIQLFKFGERRDTPPVNVTVPPKLMMVSRNMFLLIKQSLLPPPERSGRGGNTCMGGVENHRTNEWR